MNTVSQFFEYNIFRFRQFGFFKLSRELEKDLEQYLIQLRTASSSLNFLGAEEKFTLPIGIVKGVDYKMWWKIMKIEQYKKEIVELDLDDNSIFASKLKDLDRPKVDKFIQLKIDTPIVIANYVPIKSRVIIDGNHRYQASKMRGDRTIKGIILEPHEHIQYIASEQLEIVYKLHHNFLLLESLFGQLIPHETIAVNDSLGPNAYCPYNKGDSIDLSNILRFLSNHRN